jgi:opacity protein-like surface antigen
LSQSGTLDAEQIHTLTASHIRPAGGCSGTDRQIGAALGAGLEYGFTPNLSAKVEWLYITAASLEISHTNEIRAGLNYRFSGF